MLVIWLSHLCFDLIINIYGVSIQLIKNLSPIETISDGSLIVIQKPATKQITSLWNVRVPFNENLKTGCQDNNNNTASVVH